MSRGLRKPAAPVAMALSVLGVAAACSSGPTSVPGGPAPASEATPALTDLSVSRSVVDNRTRPVKVRLVAKVAGPADAVRVYFLSPVGHHSVDGYLRRSGDDQWSATFTFHRGLRPGFWPLLVDAIYDGSTGQIRGWTRPDLEAAGFPSGVRVLSAADTDRPTVRDVQVRPAIVHTGSIGSSVGIRVRVADNGSGVRRVRVFFASPAGNPHPRTASPILHRRGSVWVGRIQLDPRDPVGMWRLVRLDTSDWADNPVTLGARELHKLGLRVAFRVVA